MTAMTPAEAEICIIGSGPAALTLSTRLSESLARVRGDSQLTPGGADGGRMGRPRDPNAIPSNSAASC